MTGSATAWPYDAAMQPVDAFLAGAWRAHLDLRFAVRGEGDERRTALARVAHHGPLRVQKPLYPEGPTCCHAIVLHPPGGIAGGDTLDIDIAAGHGAHAFLTTPGAGKWYRTTGAEAAQRISIDVGADAVVEWWPQESIVFDAARARMSTQVDLAVGARYIGVETLCLGRRASGESFAHGNLRLATDIRMDGAPLWHERGHLEGGSRLLHSPIGLGGFTVCATWLAAGGDIDAATLAACRAATAAEADARCAVTALPKLLVGRYLGHSAEAARAWCVSLWRVVRPALLGREAAIPRIWHS